jgi:ferredoxin-thioredoxin reductase catalytic subunit
MEEIIISPEEIKQVYQKLFREAEAGGYHLNPDIEFTKDLIQGLLVNEKRYGYWACPCRLASGGKEEDLDIICPCDYRDADITAYDACYCALYVSQEIVEGKKKAHPIPERRPPKGQRKPVLQPESPRNISSLPLPVWRCKVCGYLCGRENPPENCPICKAKKERFERFI